MSLTEQPDCLVLSFATGKPACLAPWSLPLSMTRSQSGFHTESWIASILSWFTVLLAAFPLAEAVAPY